MQAVTITIKPVSGPIVALEVEGLHEYFLTQGDEGMLHMIAALEAMIDHLKYSSNLHPGTETVQ